MPPVISANVARHSFVADRRPCLAHDLSYTRIERSEALARRRPLRPYAPKTMPPTRIELVLRIRTLLDGHTEQGTMSPTLENLARIYKQSTRALLTCVYTHDHTDLDDVRRVWS